MKKVECAVYALYQCGEIVYIGESKNVMLRIGQHIKKGKIEFDAFDVFPVEETERMYIEYVLINVFQPRHNKQHTSVYRKAKSNKKQIYKEITGEEISTCEIEKIVMCLKRKLEKEPPI